MSGSARGRGTTAGDPPLRDRDFRRRNPLADSPPLRCCQYALMLLAALETYALFVEGPH